MNVVPDAAPAPPLLNVSALVVLAVTVVEPPRETAEPFIVMEEFVSDALAIFVSVLEAPEMVLLVRV